MTGITTKKTYEYDLDGRLVSEISESTSGDEQLEYTMTYEYDDNGNLTYQGKDTWSDGSIEESTTNEYNADNQLVSSTNQDGVYHISYNTTSYTYDENGNLISVVEQYSSSYDWDEDGIIDELNSGWEQEVEIYTYDVYGNLLSDESILI